MSIGHDVVAGAARFSCVQRISHALSSATFIGFIRKTTQLVASQRNFPPVAAVTRMETRGSD